MQHGGMAVAFYYCSTDPNPFSYPPFISRLKSCVMVAYVLFQDENQIRAAKNNTESKNNPNKPNFFLSKEARTTADSPT